MHMLSDKRKEPIWLKFIKFFLYNLVWYIIFSTIYWGLNPMDWWVIQSIWGRLLLIVLEFSLLEKSFGKKSKDNIS